MKFGQLILRKIIKIVATRYIRIDFGWSFAPDPDGELTVLPRLPK